MDEIIRVALVGVGNMGKKYGDMIAGGEVPHMKLAAVVIRRDELLPWGESLGATVYRNTDELFANPDGYDAVLIVTPHKTHPELAKRAFALGKCVLCDKPAGSVIGDAIAMDNDAKAADKVYGMIFHQRCYPKYRKLKELIDGGELGEIKRIMMVNSRYFRTAKYHASGSWRSSWKGEGGGALINQGQHILDIWQWLFGMPSRIYADIPFGKYNDFAVDDEATITMRYESGATGVFMLTTGEAHWEERLEVIGTRGKVLLEDDTMHIYRHEEITEYMKTKECNSREELEIKEEVIEYVKVREPYIEMLENFALAALGAGNESLIAPGSDSINPLMLTCGAYYSAFTGEAVTLPLDATLYDKAMKERIANENC